MRRIMSRIVVLLITAGFLAAGVTVQASAQEPGDLNGDVVAQNNAVAGAGIDSVSATTTLTGWRSWTFFFGNASGGPVTPTVSVDSGYDPSLFRSCDVTCEPFSSFPRTSTGPMLPAGEEWEAPVLTSTVSSTFAPGYDSARAMSPLVIPVGGTEQTLTVTLRASDPNLLGFFVFPFIDLPGVSFVAVNGPTNLDQGESFDWDPFSGALGQASLRSIQTGKTYVFSVVFDVPNPSGAAFTYRPGMNVYAETDSTSTCVGCPGTSVTVLDPSLDGPTPGRGAVMWSVAETGHSWDGSRSTQYAVFYEPEESPAPAFTFNGFFQPVDNPPMTNRAKAGSAIPIKFSLGGDQGLNIFASGSPSSRQIACDTGAPLDAIETTVTAGGSSLSYDASSDQYVYVWKTGKAWAGTCRQLDVQLSDGSHHVANFSFR